jgi:hypothetical protein
MQLIEQVCKIKTHAGTGPQQPVTYLLEFHKCCLNNTVKVVLMFLQIQM